MTGFWLDAGIAGECCLPRFSNNLAFLLRLLRNFCAFCVRPRIPSAPSAFAPAFIPAQSKAAKIPITSPHAPSQPFMPCNPHKHWFKAFSKQFWYSFCDFCATSAPSAFAPVFPLRPLRSLPHSFLPKQSNAQRSQLRTASLSARAARVRLVGRFRRVGCSALAILAASLA